MWRFQKKLIKTNFKKLSLFSGGTILNTFSEKKFYVFTTFLLWITNLRSDSSLLLEFNKLRDSILFLKSKSGNTFTVQYLKECHRMISKTLAGEHPVVTKPRVALRRGLPLIIPGPLRLLMEESDPSMISVVLTLMTIYSSMKCHPLLKMETITSPGTGVIDELPEVPIMMETLKLHFCFVKGQMMKIPTGGTLLNLSSSGPNSKLQVFGYPVDAFAWTGSKDLLKYFEVMSKTLKSKVFNILTQEMSCKELNPGFIFNNWSRELSTFHLGRLAFKYEAAGKVSVFAILDGWTQSLLAPLHQYLFKMLEQMPQDGTFDQTKPMLELIRKNLPYLGSFDLTAATDRLPMSLQVQILSQWFGFEFADAWRSLLVDSDYFNPKSSENVRYAVGQPMGCLSSWAMLAMTHHVMVQVAASRAGILTNSNPWFADYAVLGDDIVIGCESVAQSYLVIMSDLGVEMNLSKSVMSRTNSLEFAKRLVVGGVDVSPIGPKAMLQTMNAPSISLDLMISILKSDGATTLEYVTSMFSSFPQNWGNRLKKTISSKYWDLVTVFGLNLCLDLSSSFSTLGMDSLSKEDRVLFNNVLDNILSYRMIRRWLEDMEKSTTNYMKNIHMIPVFFNVFPSTGVILENMGKSFISLNQKKLDILSYSQQDKIRYLFSSDHTMGNLLDLSADVQSKVKSLELAGALRDSLLSDHPHIYMKMCDWSYKDYQASNLLYSKEPSSD